MQAQTTSLFILVITSTTVFFKNNYSSKKGLSRVYSTLMPIAFYLGLFLQLIIFFLLIDRPVWGETLWECRSCNVLTRWELIGGYVFSLDFFGSALILLAYVVGFLSLLCLTDRVFWKNSKHAVWFSYFLLIVVLFTTSDDLYLFFIFYELLLLPSAILVYYNSVNKRGVKASLYFLIWTQLGSILVLLAVVIIVRSTGSSDLAEIRSFYTVNAVPTGVKMLVFFGFGFKFPIWPFHFWLSKTHVEATGSFSMYLSGFLVKTAVFGFYKVYLALNFPDSNELFIAIAVFSTVDASLKLWAQVDLKKIVAYCTVQEMNLIILCFLFGPCDLIIVGVLFCIMHGLLSSIMFFTVDCLQRRFQSRQTAALTGVLQVAPTLGVFIIIMVLSFMGLPGTLKFTCELALYSALFDLSPLLFLLVLIPVSFIAPVSFARHWFGCLFGSPNKSQQVTNDVDSRELAIHVFCNVTLVLLSFISLSFF